MRKFTWTCFAFVAFMSVELSAQIDSNTADSFEIQKKILELNYEVEYPVFDSLLRKLQEYGDIHHHVLERMDEMRRTPEMHTYYPAYLSFLCSNMDSVYQKEIIDLIKTDSIERVLAYPIVKSCLFESNQKTCEFLLSQNLEDRFNKSKSLMIESLIKLKSELNCSNKMPFDERP